MRFEVADRYPCRRRSYTYWAVDAARLKARDGGLTRHQPGIPSEIVLRTGASWYWDWSACSGVGAPPRDISGAGVGVDNAGDLSGDGVGVRGIAGEGGADSPRRSSADAWCLAPEHRDHQASEIVKSIRRQTAARRPKNGKVAIGADHKAKLGGGTARPGESVKLTGGRRPGLGASSPRNCRRWLPLVQERLRPVDS